jgi:hypothetical protein
MGLFGSRQNSTIGWWRGVKLISSSFFQMKIYFAKQSSLEAA